MRTRDNDAYGEMTAADTVRFERLLPGPIERVWAYLTEADKRRQWLAGGAMDMHVGGTAALLFRHSEFTDEPTPEKFSEMDKGGFSAQCRITQFDPPRLLGLTWPGDGTQSEVAFELFPEGDKVLLVVTHTRLADRAEMANVASGWHAHMEVLERLLTGRGEDRFWSRVRQLESEYTGRFAAG